MTHFGHLLGTYFRGLAMSARPVRMMSTGDISPLDGPLGHMGLSRVTHPGPSRDMGSGGSKIGVRMGSPGWTPSGVKQPEEHKTPVLVFAS